MAEKVTEYSGTLERIVYQNEDTGWTVARLRCAANAPSLAIVGYFPTAQIGQQLNVQGEWQTHAKFGQQFTVAHYDVVLPTTSTGMEQYLASGLVKGIGPAMAGRLIDHFGTDVFTVMDTQIERLREIPGIGPIKFSQIAESWQSNRELRSLIAFLQEYDVSPKLAHKIYRAYGSRSIEVLQQNPYQLAVDVSGVGFHKADQIARRMGLPEDAPFRLRAGLLLSLQTAMSKEGHTCLPQRLLLDNTAALLRFHGADKIRQELQALVDDGKHCLAINGLLQEDRAIYLTPIYECERDVASHILRLLAGKAPRSLSAEEITAFIDQEAIYQAIQFSPSQRTAIATALSAKLSIITGGPGTGKTTILRSLLAFFNTLELRVQLAAPTGRAAKRMQESTQIPAKTIHRLLEFTPDGGLFLKGPENPLDCDVLILDETSMLDISLARAILAAIPAHAQCILVGDSHQLPSVGAGNVLHDLLASGRIPAVELQEVFRQGSGSLIAINAHRIRHGELPIEKERDSELSDFYFIGSTTPETAIDMIRQLVTERIPKRFGIAAADIQVLSPMNQGPLGVHALNQHLQSWLNSTGRQSAPTLSLRLGDRVMQTRNNYDLDVFNGDIGTVAHYDSETETLHVKFDQRTVAYTSDHWDELALAYAITVHKSQGSEYPVVIFPVVGHHYVMLRRNLVYTALTRAKQLAIFIGSKSALTRALTQADTGQRFSGLKAWLKLK